MSKDVREQIKWLCLFFMKDQDGFEDCLRENDVVPDKNERDRLKKCLQDAGTLNEELLETSYYELQIYQH